MDQGQEVDSIALQAAFSQGVNYHLLVNFSPTDCKVIAFGEILALGADTAPLKLNSFEIELFQEAAAMTSRLTEPATSRSWKI